MNPAYTAMSADGHAVRWTTWSGDAEELVTVTWDNEAWTASGEVGRERVQYVLRLSPTWQVRQFLLFRDLDEPDLWLVTDGSARWAEMNGTHRPEFDGCYDLDLACTPFTQTLPIRRLPLNIGDSAEINVVVVDVDILEVVPHLQRYLRLDTHRWELTDVTSGRATEFDVDDYGLVVDLPEQFRRMR